MKEEEKTEKTNRRNEIVHSKNFINQRNDCTKGKTEKRKNEKLKKSRQGENSRDKLYKPGNYKKKIKNKKKIWEYKVMRRRE